MGPFGFLGGAVVEGGCAFAEMGSFRRRRFLGGGHGWQWGEPGMARSFIVRGGDGWAEGRIGLMIGNAGDKEVG